jgi:methionyl aminopeptidase
MSADDPKDLAGLQRAGTLVAATIDVLERAVAPGVTTGQLDRMAAALFASAGARSGPIITYGYPGSICISVDDEIVHGVPGSRVLREGQLVTLDVAAELDGYHADSAITVAVGEASPEARNLIAATERALATGIAAAQPGASFRDLGAAIERSARASGYSVFRSLTGHSIGRGMHEEPTVYNWPEPSATARLTDGLVFTIEPMLGAGGARMRDAGDGWTICTADGSLAAHAEHTVMVAQGGPRILTRRDAAL